MSNSFIQALESLEKHDAVIGQAFDGGYYLIGFRKDTFKPEAFQGIEWSTDKVFEETTKIMKRLGLKFYVLPKFRDIDKLDDLIDLVKNCHDDFRDSNAMNYIPDIFLM